ncbi:hypothetical protein ACOQFV_24240 [Nocardiopsis changdeensis]|uniref:PPM-type phosphatase domain-containing protein n=1 Tax=Nocardiopsis changdeensis TaxID=2831969 RepID=A0A975KUY6_9ACTN|nr:MULTISPECIES: hypothetical protein [Nocardiopsis]QUX26496.1 hypothetical protein KGD84_32890 [Nocardiopsis changdeensis]QYX40768.1 hypothetical protein K1J57_32740 [Nocardiopsis sp. MT53]
MPSAPASPVRVGTATDQGPRPSQCDAVTVTRIPLSTTWAAALVDGYGPHPDVPAAAQGAALAAIRSALSGGSAPAALETAGRTLTGRDADDWPEPDAVGAVAVGDDQRVSVAWTGDVRAYVLDPDGQTLHQLTTDHTEGARLRALAAAGEPVAEDPAEHDHVVTSTLGRLAADPASMGTATHSGPWTAVVLTSDGVHDALDHAELHRIVAATADPAQCAAALVAAARAADARAGAQAVDDNATAAVIRQG